MVLSKLEKGTKRVCENCNGRFYDLKKVPPICPICKQKLENYELNYLNSLSQNNNIQKAKKNATEIDVMANDESETDNTDDINATDNEIISLEDADEEINN